MNLLEEVVVMDLAGMEIHRIAPVSAELTCKELKDSIAKIGPWRRKDIVLTFGGQVLYDRTTLGSILTDEGQSLDGGCLEISAVLPETIEERARSFMASGDPGKRRGAMSWFTRYSERFVDDLGACLRDETLEDKLVLQAIGALGRLGDTAAPYAADLCYCLTDPRRSCYAMSALRQIGKAALPALEKALEEGLGYPDHETRRLLIQLRFQTLGNEAFKHQVPAEAALADLLLNGEPCDQEAVGQTLRKLEFTHTHGEALAARLGPDALKKATALVINPGIHSQEAAVALVGCLAPLADETDAAHARAALQDLRSRAPNKKVYTKVQLAIKLLDEARGDCTTSACTPEAT